MVLLRENQTLALRVKARPACAASHLLDRVCVVLCPTGHACHRAVLFGWTHKSVKRTNIRRWTNARQQTWMVLLMMTRYAGKFAPTANVLVAKRQKSARLTNRCSTMRRSA